MSRTREIASNFVMFLQTQEYAKNHWTGQLAAKSFVSHAGDNTIVIIPADTYDIGAWFREGVIIHNGRGSYASDNDSGRGGLKFSGSATGDKRRDKNIEEIDGIKVKPSHKHKNFVVRNVKRAVHKYCEDNGYRYVKAEVH